MKNHKHTKKSAVHEHASAHTNCGASEVFEQIPRMDFKDLIATEEGTIVMTYVESIREEIAKENYKNLREVLEVWNGIKNKNIDSNEVCYEFSSKLEDMLVDSSKGINFIAWMDLVGGWWDKREKSDITKMYEKFKERVKK